MMGITHMTIGAAVSALALQTANPTLLLTGAIASLLPDIDISTSPAGRVFPYVSRWLESRGSHRGCTHSIIASGVVGVTSLVIANAGLIPFLFAKSLTIGYTAGWLADLFTKAGVEMFYPSPVRWVCPGNRNLRLATGSSAEYGILVVLVQVKVQPVATDKYGRTVAQLWVQRQGGESLLQSEMVSGGMAYPYDRYSKDCPDWDAVTTVGNRAQSERIGVFGQPELEKPWNYRKSHR